MSRKALILGIGGQDGYYLTNLLYRKGYEVWGMFRPEDVSEDVISGLKGPSNCIAGDTVKAMWLMLQQDEPEDFVIGSGQLYTIQNCLDVAFSYLGIEWKNYVRTDLKFVRPPDARPLLADPTRAKKILGWQPKVGFEKLIEMMVKVDTEELR